MICKIESLLFVVLGNFITSCYTGNWAWQDLLRQPIRISGSLQQGKLLIFKIPNWLPVNDSILRIPSMRVESKVKDLFVATQINRQSETESLLLIHGDGLFTNSGGGITAELCYWPMYRFAIEPISYSDKISPSQYVIRSIDYVMRLSGVPGELDLERMTIKTQDLIVHVGGAITFDSLLLIEPEGTSTWSLLEKVIRLSGGRMGVFNFALDAMLSRGESLERCSVRRADRSVELRCVE